MKMDSFFCQKTKMKMVVETEMTGYNGEVEFNSYTHEKWNGI